MNWELVGTIVGIVVAAIPVVVKAIKIWKEKKDWKEIAKISMDFIENQLANKDSVEAEKDRAKLQFVQKSANVEKKVDMFLDEIRSERLNGAKNGTNGLEIGTDIDPIKGKWNIGASWRKTF